MRRAAVVTVIAVFLLVGAAYAVFEGALVFIERQRVADATAAFAPVESLGACILSQPIAFHRHCRYVVEFPETSRLSDDNVAELSSLNALPPKNYLELSIATPGLTDRSLPALKSIETFDVLDVTETSISDGGIEELRQAFPDCIVLLRK